MSDRDVYHKATSAAKKAGYVLVRRKKHERWETPDGAYGFSLSQNIRDKNRAQAVLRNAGPLLKDVRL